MKTIAVFTPVLLAAACSNPAPTTVANSNTTKSAVALTEPKSASGEGSITAIDPGTGKITLAHGPIAELNWPAMTMGFATTDRNFGGLKVRDKVRFKFRWDGRTAEIEAIDKI